MRATIRQVAELAKVSPVTVSNVLRGHDHRASPETRQRVLEAARALNYIPVQAPTVQNRRNQTRVISLVFEHTDITHHIIDLHTYEGIVEGAKKHGYDLLTLLREQPEWTTEGDDVRFLDRRSDGLIFAISMIGRWERALETLSRHQIPTVVCYRRQTPDGIAWVDVDNAGAVETMVNHLVELGHQKIAYITGPNINYNALERERAFSHAMANHGLQVPHKTIVRGYDDNYLFQIKNIASVLKLDVTAVVCFNDSLALQLWDIAEEQGLKIPNDLSIIGIDNIPASETRGLTTIQHSFADVGRLAVEAWLELQSGKSPNECHKTAPVTLIERNSTHPSA